MVKIVRLVWVSTLASILITIIFSFISSVKASKLLSEPSPSSLKFADILPNAGTENEVFLAQVSGSGAVELWGPCDQAPANPLTTTLHNLDQTADDWGVYCEPSPVTNGFPQWIQENVSTPSLDGQALRCHIAGGEPYANIHCYRNISPTVPADTFELIMPFFYTPTTTYNASDSIVQALEFSMSQWQGGTRHEFALQWMNVGSGGPQWRYWDPSQQPQPWVALGITDVITGGQWHTFTLKGQIRENLVNYQQFCLNQQCHLLNAIAAPASTPGEPNRLAVAFQLDGNFQGDAYDVFVDQVNLDLAISPQDVFLNGSSIGLVGSSYSFTATIQPITTTTPLTYIWQATDQIPVTQTGTLTNTIAFTWQSSGTKVITVTAVNHGSLVTTTHIITLFTPAQAGFTAVPTSGTPPLTVTFTNTSTGDYDTCFWEFGDEQTSTDCKNPQHIYTGPGVYTVTLTTSGQGSIDSYSMSEYVSAWYSLFLPFIINL